jgi:hypothetical protein
MKHHTRIGEAGKTNKTEGIRFPQDAHWIAHHETQNE